MCMSRYIWNKVIKNGYRVTFTNTIQKQGNVKILHNYTLKKFTV